MKKRFSFWSASGRPPLDHGAGTGKGKGTKTGGQKAGEMGEILREEDEKEGTVKLGPSLMVKSSTSAEVQRKSVDVTPKSVEVPKANANGVARLEVPALAPVAGTTATVAATSEAAVSKPPSDSASPVRSTEVVAPIPVITHQAESAPAPHRLEETVFPPKIVVSEPYKSAVDPIPKPLHPVPVSTKIPTTKARISVPAVVEHVAPSADVPITKDMTIVSAVKSEPTVGGHVTEHPERTVVPEVVVHPAPAAQAEGTETDVTINVEIVEPMPFSDTPPATARVQSAVLAHAPEHVEVLSHTEPLHVHHHGAEDHGVVQDAVPIVQVDVLPVGESTVEEALGTEVPRETEPSVVPAAIKGSRHVNATAEPVQPDEETREEELPPAPESVVLSGETPGPAIALSTSERVTMAHVTVAEDEDETQPADHKSNGSADSSEPLGSVPDKSSSAPARTTTSD